MQTRRNFLATAAAAGMAYPMGARADYADRPIHIIVGDAAGGGANDDVDRAIGIVGPRAHGVGHAGRRRGGQKVSSCLHGVLPRFFYASLPAVSCLRMILSENRFPLFGIMRYSPPSRIGGTKAKPVSQGK